MLTASFFPQSISRNITWLKKRMMIYDSKIVVAESFLQIRILRRKTSYYIKLFSDRNFRKGPIKKKLIMALSRRLKSDT